MAADILWAVCNTYHIYAITALQSLGELQGISNSRILAAGGVTLVMLLVVAIAVFFPVKTIIRDSHRRRAAVCLMAFAAISLSVDCVTVVRRTGHLPGTIRNPLQLAEASGQADVLNPSRFTELQIIRMPVIRLALNVAINEIQLAQNRKLLGSFNNAALSAPSAAALAIHFATHSPGENAREMPNLVIILVESWGLASDLSVNESMLRPYSQPDLVARYEVLSGTVPFFGSTVAGEGRELCGSRIGFYLGAASARELQGCVPDRLAASGYSTLALHGMNGLIFKRRNWYSTIGFQEIWFHDGFKRQGLPDCLGAFIGTCDAAIAEWIGHRIEKPSTKPDFVWWVTLNSHLPVLVPSPVPNPASCTFSSTLSQQPALCSWYQTVANVQRSVAKLALSKSSRPTVFAIVGDHAPPFSNSVLRSQFSWNVVPYVLLVPRPDSRVLKKLSD
jgi:phosphoglycerol transferase MdoB-like AlkP superfamily enzyme